MGGIGSVFLSFGKGGTVKMKKNVMQTNRGGVINSPNKSVGTSPKPLVKKGNDLRTGK